MPRPLLYGLAGVLTLVTLVLTLAYLFQRKLIYLPTDGPLPHAADLLPGAREVTFATADGLRLAAWFVPGPGATVLVLAGNAGNRADRAPLAAALRARGLAVLLVDYRGYGGNPGDPTEEGLALDARAARAHLIDHEGVRPDRLVYYGESLGAAVAARLAAEHPPAGLVLRSPFVDLPSAAAVHYPVLPVRALLKDTFPVADTVRRVRVPTAVVYGTADEVVPPDQSQAVADAAAGPVTRVAVAGADHNDRVLLDGPDLIDAVAALAR
ncbi:alpha/beta hydrolase [Actinokineospora sp.]|uniref:alpha/beta hydrolase n=1 Tax=Actinokineospora sp. TaxID=1872133 RepID=UPI00403767B8